MRLASVLWLSILKVVIICSLVLTLISWTFLEACTIEIWPIVSVVPSAHFIVVGTVDSIRPEVTYRDEESDIGVRELVSTIIQVERVLKGDLEPGPLVLSFSEGISHSGCNFLLEPYKVDNRLLLMITEEDEGSYFSPLVPPVSLCLVRIHLR